MDLSQCSHYGVDKEEIGVNKDTLKRTNILITT